MTNRPPPFGGTYYKALIREAGWPQKKGLFRKEVVPIEVAISAGENLIDNAKMVGLLKPSIGIRMLGHGYANRDWVAMPPDNDLKSSLDQSAAKGFTLPEITFLEWDMLSDPRFGPMIEIAFLGALLTGLQGGVQLADELDSTYADYLKGAAEMSTEEQKLWNVNTSLLPSTRQEYADVFQKDIFEHWEKQFGRLPDPPQSVTDFVYLHRATDSSTPEDSRSYEATESRSVSPSPYEKSSSAEASGTDVHEVSNRAISIDVRNTSIRLAMYVAAINGRLSQAKGALVRDWALDRIDSDISGDKSNLNGVIRTAFENVTNKELALEPLIDNLRSDGNISEVNAVIDLIDAIIQIDGPASNKELDVLARIHSQLRQSTDFAADK